MKGRWRFVHNGIGTIQCQAWVLCDYGDKVSQQDRRNNLLETLGHAGVRARDPVHAW